MTDTLAPEQAAEEAFSTSDLAYVGDLMRQQRDAGRREGAEQMRTAIARHQTAHAETSTARYPTVDEALAGQEANDD